MSSRKLEKKITHAQMQILNMHVASDKKEETMNTIDDAWHARTRRPEIYPVNIGPRSFARSVHMEILQVLKRLSHARCIAIL